jgi:flagellar hook-length control protein FliK
MSPLNLSHLSDFVHTELVIPPSVPLVRGGNATESFEQHLEQATQTVGGATGTRRPPTADSRPDKDNDQPIASSPPASEPRGDAVREADPSDGEPNPQTADKSQAENGPKTEACENRPESDQKADASETQSDDEQQARASEGERAGRQEDDRGQRAAPPKTARTAGEPELDTPAKSSKQQAVQSADPVSGDNGTEPDSQGQTAEPTQGKTSSAATGALLPNDSEQAKPSQAKVALEQNVPEEGQTDEEESSLAREGKKTSGKDAPQPARPAEASSESGDAASQTSATSQLLPVGTSPQKQKAASGPRRQPGEQGVGSSAIGDPRDGASAEGAPDVASASMQQDGRTAPDTASPTGIKTGVGPPPADAKLPGDSEGETTAPTRVDVDQGLRRTSATRRSEPSGADQTDRVRFVQRVARAFEMLGQRGGSLRLRLHPPELGSLRLEVSVRNGVMSARLEVETTSARNMLLDNLPALRQRLAEQDIRVGRFDVDLTGRPPGGSPQRPSDQPPPHDYPHGNPPGAGSDPHGEAERPAQPGAVARPSEGSQLDVII